MPSRAGAAARPPHAASDPNAIVVSGVSRRFVIGRRSVDALSDIDLRVGRGEFVTLFGPSGCGKSTLLRLLCGLDKPDSGDISLFLQGPRTASERKNIAWIPQSPALLPWLSLRDNVTLSNVLNRGADWGHSERNPQDPDEVLRLLGLADFADARPGQLSGGMRQRAAIARGFVQGAPIMLMDEPFAALDDITREQSAMYLLDLWQRYKTTLVFVTHSAAEAALLSDRVVVMTPRPGRIHTTISVDLDRPRNPEAQDGPGFQAQVGAIRKALRQACAGSVPA